MHIFRNNKYCSEQSFEPHSRLNEFTSTALLPRSCSNRIVNKYIISENLINELIKFGAAQAQDDARATAINWKEKMKISIIPISRDFQKAWIKVAKKFFFVVSIVERPMSIPIFSMRSFSACECTRTVSDAKSSQIHFLYSNWNGSGQCVPSTFHVSKIQFE